jgi:hypothetical protein
MLVWTIFAMLEQQNGILNTMSQKKIPHRQIEGF